MSINRKRGFTLLEMMLALGVFTLIVGTLLFTTRSAFQLSTQIAEMRYENQKISTFYEFLQSAFRTMPANSSIRYDVEEKEGSLQSVLKLSNISSICPEQYQTNDIQFFMRKQLDGRSDLMISHDTNASFTLLQKIESINWQFYNPQTQKWETNWLNPGARPSLVELTLKPKDSLSTLKMTFWIPNVGQVVK